MRCGGGIEGFASSSVGFNLMRGGARARMDINSDEREKFEGGWRGELALRVFAFGGVVYRAVCENCRRDYMRMDGFYSCEREEEVRDIF